MGQQFYGTAAEMSQRSAAIDSFADTKRRMAANERLAIAIAGCDPRDSVQIMAAALDDMAAGCPEFAHGFFDTLRADAAFWADIATPAEIEAYVAAGLRQIERMAFGLKQRKRIFASMWTSFSAEDQKAFLSKVDPAGKFWGRG